MKFIKATNKLGQWWERRQKECTITKEAFKRLRESKGSISYCAVWMGISDDYLRKLESGEQWISKHDVGTLSDIHPEKRV